MTPIDFPEANAQALDDVSHCGTIPLMTTPDGGAISCWELSDYDKQQIAEFGRIFLIHDIKKGFRPVIPVSNISDYVLDEQQPLSDE